MPGKPKLIVLAHGIGDSQAGFQSEWVEAFKDDVNLTGITVKGLLWEDVLQKVADKYPAVSGQAAALGDLLGSPALAAFTGQASWKAISDFAMDLLVYVGLPDMWLYIQDTCKLKLAELRAAGTPNEVPADQTILLGHSLGAAMLPQLVWDERAQTGGNPYYGLILLASPLGFTSPGPAICRDFLQCMARPGQDRAGVLKSFAMDWRVKGPGRLKFISNRNDIVCSTVTFEIPGRPNPVDLIPILDGFTDADLAKLEANNPGCVEWVEFGDRSPASLMANHDVIAYLKQPAFAAALKTLLVG